MTTLSTLSQKPIVEVCTASLQSVANAVSGGAQRIELCAALRLDGLTPSLGLLTTVRQLYPELTVHVLIRPREGDFVYSHREVLVMERDIQASLPYADGFVVGALDGEGRVDVPVMQCLMAAAEGKPVTFHRAFDVCAKPLEALEQIIALGCQRLLTSGQQPRAELGIPLLRRLCDLSQGRLIVMPGGGIGPGNARMILSETGATELHGSFSNGSGLTSAATVSQTLSVL